MTTLYGPHCSHDECSWMECEDVEFEHPCQGQDTCPRCGPGSPEWPRFARDMAAFLREQYGTVSERELRAKLHSGSNVDYSNIFRYARLLRLHGSVIGEPSGT